MWIAALLLSLAAAGIGRMVATDPESTACPIPEDPHVLRGLASADEVRDRSSTDRVRVRRFLQALWSDEGAGRATGMAQIVVTEDHSDFLLPPLGLLPNFELATDETPVRMMDVGSETLRVRFRINQRHLTPYVVGWVYAMKGEPVDDPIPFLLKRAFQDPWHAAPPLTLITAESEGGPLSVESRIAVVQRRLAMLWRDWSGLCRI